MLRISLVMGAALALSASSAHAYKPEVPCTKAQVATVASTTVQISHEFPPDKIETLPDGQKVYGYSGSAWKIDDHRLATIAHVPVSMKLQPDEWLDVTISQASAEYETAKVILTTKARLLHVGRQGLEESEAIIELMDPLPEQVAVARRRYVPVNPQEGVMAVGYTHGVLRFATGRLAFPDQTNDSDGKPARRTHLKPYELYDEDKNDRLAIDYGASGGPVFACSGEVVAIMAKVKTQNLNLGKAIAGMQSMLQSLRDGGVEVPQERFDDLNRVSTHWGSYNVLALPVEYLPQ